VSEHRVHHRCACGSELGSSSRFEHMADAQSFVLAGTARVYERPRPFVIDHIALDLAVDHPNKSLSGSAELHVKRVNEGDDELRLDAVGFDIAAVHARAGGKKAPWRAAKHSYDGETLVITLAPQRGPFVVRVQYAASPRRGMYFLAPDEAVPERPRQVWTQCQDEDARHIFPCHDKPHIKQTMDIRVSVEPGWFVLSNGDLVSGKQAQKKGEFHYRMGQAQPSYLFTVVAGDFAVLEDAVGELPVTYYVPPGKEEDGWRTFARTPQMIRLFAELSGTPYPWTKYAQVVVHDFIFGGMENTGATTMYEHILLDERAALDVSSDDLIAHELAHQWFGDLVTCRDWSHAWLNEGFATFMEHVWRDHHLGEDEYHHGLLVDLRAYLGEAAGRYRRPVVCQDYEAPIDVFDRHLYEKGGLFLHSLRRQIGHEVFWRAVKSYLQAHAGSVVETRDLLRAMEAASGESLEQLFEQGLFRAAHPRLDVVVSYESGALTVAVTQTIDDGGAPFGFDLEIDIAHGGSRKPAREVRRVSQLRHTFAFAAPERPRFVVIDPELRIIGRVNEKVPADMLRNQLLEAPTGRGRVLAAEALARRDDPATIRALGEVLGNARLFWGARGAAATALGCIRSPAAFRELKQAIRTKHPKVRRAVAKALGSFRTPEAAAALTRIARDDASYQVAAAACRALGETRQAGAYEALVEMLERPAWADMLRGGAIEGLSQLRDRRAVEHVRAATRYGVPERGRRTAVSVLPSMSSSRKTRESLEEVLDDGNPHLRVSAAVALGELGDGKARPALRQLLERELDGRVRRRVREVLRDLPASSKREARQLREELDQLRRSHQELTARLSKLEETAASERKSRKR
jgi:aminopeptidase N